MGFGSSIKKAVKSASKAVTKAAEQTYHEYDRYTESKLGAYATPYLSMYDSDGRAALSKAWGGWATAGASVVNPAAGAAVGTAVSAFNAYNAPTPRSEGSAFAPIAQPPIAPATPMEAGIPWGLIGGGVAGLAALALTALVIVKARG